VALRTRFLLSAIVVAIVLAVAIIGWTEPRQTEGAPELSLAAQWPQLEFTRADQVRPIRIPEDHGPHPEYQTEWWYFTGNLEGGGGRRFGYQLTFFRRGLDPHPPDRSSEFAASQIYFAHLAVTDVESGEHKEWERFSRGAAGLAGAQSPSFRVWLEDWEVEATDAGGSELRLRAEADDFRLSLDLETTKPLARHGLEGLSPKSEEPGNASYYVSYTNLSTIGEIALGGEVQTVRGSSWFDHEWSTSALGEGAVGWDWFSLQFESGREIMYYQIRRGDGTIEPVSAGTVVEADGTTRSLGPEDITLLPTETWLSRQSNAVYPVAWSMSIPEEGLRVEIESLLEDQEMNVSFTYWEGAVQVAGEWGGESVQGFGYLEMTGYAESMQGTL
jgi:predicted secreted hydrolase